MTHMLCPGHYPHGQHHDSIGYRNLCGGASHNRDVFLEHCIEVEFFGELPQVYQSSVGGKLFFGKLKVIVSHGFYASFWI
jgi:hypothetical protein